ncbi:nucleotidyltransferase [Candidatus Roizmanbacteria bacterium CG06_land_8_20_14_3_00_34_14]|uniref:Nucleotidyltransferase n=2 Tax=Candidatus Roizmaniibacteriota TaxID=1752723 RepID=A0A2M7ATU9_9BACT|nr:MAG: nucleotidyltransferase [Candidatus Roizmanbacteria bacterium CG07_land_8_20_14_0_80_34_15]PIU74059.1 MAG: nucleotidyltransferase [Candidatus Roizmanbacteria bacterium CG06_land_8_20_14_3_00_34_14]
MINEKIKSIVSKYIINVKKQGIPVWRVYIFGSYVKGTADIHSDIDVCVISKKFGKDRQKERVMLMNIRSENDGLIEPHPFSPEDFLNPYDPLAYQIKNHGLLVM